MRARRMEPSLLGCREHWTGRAPKIVGQFSGEISPLLTCSGVKRHALAPRRPRSAKAGNDVRRARGFRRGPPRQRSERGMESFAGAELRGVCGRSGEAETRRNPVDVLG